MFSFFNLAFAGFFKKQGRGILNARLSNEINKISIKMHEIFIKFVGLHFWNGIKSKNDCLFLKPYFLKIVQRL